MASRSVQSWLPMVLALGVGMPVGNIAVRELRPDIEKWPAIFLGSLIGGLVGLVVFGIMSWLLGERRG